MVAKIELKDENHGKKEEYADVFPYSLADLTALGEYAMWMKVKLDSKQSADFIRGITPVLFMSCR